LNPFQINDLNFVGKNRSTLKLWREFADSEKKRRYVPLEHPEGRQKKLCFQGGSGGRLGR
jgi:hypothetical protein